MATLKELADRTGYSPATISPLLTGHPSLSPPTRRARHPKKGRTLAMSFCEPRSCVMKLSS